MNRTILQTLALMLLALSLAGQTPYTETVEVRVVNVDVVVTDRSGKPVEGLTAEDFVVYEGGKQQALTNFYEIRGSRRASAEQPAEQKQAAEPEPDPRVRRIAILLDNQSMVPTTRNAVLKKIRDFLPRLKRPNDEVMVATIYNGLKIDLQFSKDMNAINAALDAAEKAPVNGVRMQQARRDTERDLRDLIDNYALNSVNTLGGGERKEQPPYTDAINTAQHYASIVRHNSLQATDAARSFLASLAGLDGRKIVLLATESMPTYAGREMFEYLDSMKARFAGGETRQPVTDNMNANDIGPMVVQLAGVANQSGVTLYPIHVGGPTQILRTADESDDNDLAFHSNTGFKNVSAAQSINNTNVLPFLAAETGGVAITESSNFNLLLGRIENDLTSYYSIGYRPTRGPAEKPQAIEVRLKEGRNLQVRYRSGISDRPSESVQQEAVTAALSHDAQKNDLGVRLQALEVVALEDGSKKVPVKVIIPMEALTLLPEGEDLTGKVSILVRFARNDGVMSEVSRRTNDFRFPASTRSRRKELTIQTEFTMQPDVRRVSVGVIDELSQATGFATYEPVAQ